MFSVCLHRRYKFLIIKPDWQRRRLQSSRTAESQDLYDMTGGGLPKSAACRLVFRRSRRNRDYLKLYFPEPISTSTYSPASVMLCMPGFSLTETLNALGMRTTAEVLPGTVTVQLNLPFFLDQALSMVP